MLDDAARRCFDTIYATDLVYVSNCWKLCGDGHCCHMTRYKSGMGMMGARQKQEIPLLPGEMEYLRSRGLDAQFGAYEHRVSTYRLAQGEMKVEFLVGWEKTCACAHDQRIALCRLYPLWPTFDVDGRLKGVDLNFSPYEELEDIDGVERGCKVDVLPLTEVGKLLDIVNAMATVPKFVFYSMAYQLTKAHAKARLRAMIADDPEATALNTYEAAFLLGRLFDPSELKPQLEALADRFKLHYGDRFSLEGPPVEDGLTTVVREAGAKPEAPPASGRKLAAASPLA